jgi:hypothetical protein
VLAATQTSGEKGMTWFRGTADAVRQFIWMFEVSLKESTELTIDFILIVPMHESLCSYSFLSKIKILFWNLFRTRR